MKKIKVVVKFKLCNHLTTISFKVFLLSKKNERSVIKE